MTFFLTIVASSSQNPLKEKHFKECVRILLAYNIEATGPVTWLSKDKAGDLALSQDASSATMAHLRDFLEPYAMDFFITPALGRRKTLLLADMDSTIATSETLDDLAGHVGLKDRISEITARAMNGELDFHTALKERIALLNGLPVSALAETTHTALSAGAKSFIQTMKAHGAFCALVSGGFTYFTQAIAESTGFDAHHGNTLEIQNDCLTGQVIPPILDKFAKLDVLDHYVKTLGITPAHALTIGDGANDIPMLKAAGLGIGYHPKPAVAAELKNRIVHGDLTSALYAQGYAEKDFHST